MVDVNKKIDDLHQTFYANVAERERKSYTLLPFRPYFVVEKILGVSRLVERNGELRAPSWYQRVHSIIMASLMVYVSYPSGRTPKDHQIVDFLDSFFFSLSRVSVASVYVIVTVRNALFGPYAYSLRPFLMLRDLDIELNILGHRKIHTRYRTWNTLAITWVIILNSFLLGLTALMGYVSPKLVIIVLAMVYCEMQPMMCTDLALSLEKRLRHLALLSETQYLTEMPKSDSDFQVRSIDHFNFNKIVLIYEKIMAIFDDVNEEFQLKVLADLMSISTITLVIFWNLLLDIKAGSEDHFNYFVYIANFVRSFIRIMRFCRRLGSFTVAVEQFKLLLLEIIHLDHPEWSPQARALLTYSETRSGVFKVCGMFNMDTHLPFTYMASMLSICIALIQIVFVQT